MSQRVDTPLYQPSDPLATPTFHFLNDVNHKFDARLRDYQDLYRWSTQNIDKFWSLVWDNTHIIGHKGDHVVDYKALPSANPPWFKNARLNWAENMLQCRSSTQVALIQATEPSVDNASPHLRKCTYAELYELVAALVSALHKHGVKAGDRVASYSSNCIENIAACLAATAIGGIWVSAAADFGPEGVLERFEQVKPAIIFAVDAVVYNQKVHNHIPKLSQLLAGLSEDRSGWEPGWIGWDAFIEDGRNSKKGITPQGEIEWNRLPFDAPLWILFSSGTTGKPKPIVHRAGGMLIQAKKEFSICGDLGSKDVFFYYTTIGWMMWNFLTSGLCAGSTLVLYDGSPLRDPALLWKLVDDLGITIFGTSAKYLDQLSKVYCPRKHHDLSTLRQIYSTGSPLAPSLFDFVYEQIHPNVLLGSITGGTDICSLFAGMNTALPVYRGEIQCRMLGMAIESFSTTGELNPPEEEGELVCLKPFPCMPIGFWPLPGYGNDDDATTAQLRFQQSYFAEYEGVWYHGDHVIITRSKSGNAGGIIMLGRSDGVLNPSGVRFGSSEIYDVLDLCFSNVSSPELFLVDSLAVGQKVVNGADERVVLFVKLLQGQCLSNELQQKIRAEIRTRRSPRHVPARIIQVPDIPYTLNGKRVEVLIKRIINGAHLSSVNRATLSNPECLEFYRDTGEILRQEIV
ncbi:hypothetical protein Agabi119p4_4538 [Agaricus bisporus var. burnettii]|uniref:AMP-dependent synthetase/ligase domain-containing protein n=1 Tax=Agaricus bisporus var. burnettii TaxID=192524 RepID=A0A8H7KHE1_AGABI|nr:hypothetical protein Agabi119p4_4538 [Agaricus bisporus var. burnettii]